MIWVILVKVISLESLKRIYIGNTVILLEFCKNEGHFIYAIIADSLN